MIAVAMVNRQQVQVLSLELTRAFRADPTVQGQRTLAVSLRSRLRQTARLLDDVADRFG